LASPVHRCWGETIENSLGKAARLWGESRGASFARSSHTMDVEGIGRAGRDGGRRISRVRPQTRYLGRCLVAEPAGMAVHPVRRAEAGLPRHHPAYLTLWRSRPNARSPARKRRKSRRSLPTRAATTVGFFPAALIPELLFASRRSTCCDTLIRNGRSTRRQVLPTMSLIVLPTSERAILNVCRPPALIELLVETTLSLATVVHRALES
jgi:hypothetical protein